MTSSEVRKRFLAFFAARGHAIIPSASLVPENDPSVLFNTAGMQPLVPYLLGNPHPQGDKLANIQKCIRTGDIDEVGDNTHLTFFEMLGNWSLGSYFKEDAIKWSYELLTSKTEGFGLDPKRLYVTVFAGDSNSERDEDAAKIWESAGLSKNRIYFKGAEANWWPAVKGKDAWTGPTGPCSEMFYDLTEEGLGDLTVEQYNKADEEQKIVEIWNDVFMQFEKKNGKIIANLTKKNVDTGAGLERLCTVLQKKSNVFDTDIFADVMLKIKNLSSNWNIKSSRIVADHIKAAVFMISDGVLPGNSDAGYVVRKIIRRAVRHSGLLAMNGNLIEVVQIIQDQYKDVYPNVMSNDKGFHIQHVIQEEETKFKEILEKGGALVLKKIFNSAIGGIDPDNHNMVIKGNIIKVNGKDLFNLYQTHGLPIEVSQEIMSEWGVAFDEQTMKEANDASENHRKLSQAGAEQKFKGGLGDTSETSLKYHTATHLLHQALRQVLGTHVQQKGSNITAERLRFDFVHTAKMTDEEKKKVEDIVNAQIKANLTVHRIELPKAEAEKTGALHFFGDKYGDTVSVYYMGDSIDHAFSKEFCGGPHVENTGTLGTFKIQKEEAVSAGVRRIKAVLS